MHRPLSIQIAKGLERRKISPETATTMGIYSGKFSPDGVVPDANGDILCFAFLEYDDEVNTKYRTVVDGERRLWQRKDAVKTLYNANAILEDDNLVHLESGVDPLIWTEGELDCASAVECGFPYCISLPDGAMPGRDHQGKLIQVPEGTADIDPASDEKFSFFARHEDRLTAVKLHLIATDDDDSGRRMAKEIVRRLGPAQCLRPTYPAEPVVTDKHTGKKRPCKDLNEILCHFGREAVEAFIREAKPWPVRGLYRLDDYPDAETPEVYETGISTDVDRLFRLYKGAFIPITGKPGSGKALALDTLVPTPNGWTTMGEISVGDIVYAEDGRLCRVVAATEVMQGRPCYRIGFDNGISVVADAEHQWFTNTNSYRKHFHTRSYRPYDAPLKPRGTDQRYKLAKPGIVTTEEIAATIIDNNKKNHQVKLSGAIEGLDSILLIDPYTLGVWLGDGHSAGGRVTCFDDEIIDVVERNGNIITKQKSGLYGLPGLQTKLRAIGVFRNKHIPMEYLRASVQHRQSLLKGLMDTDGCCFTGGSCEFSVVSRRLAEDFYELACSLGIKATFSEDVAKIAGRVIGPRYRIRFTTGIPVFRLTRKLGRQGVGRPNRVADHVIRSCEPVTSVPVRCIQVDSPSNQFLITKAFIATHNSTLLNQMTVAMARVHRWHICMFTGEEDVKPYIQDELMTAFLDKAKPKWSSDDRQRARAFVNRYYTFISHDPRDGEGELTLDFLLRTAAVSCFRYGTSLLVIDPWNEIDHSARPAHMSETEYIGNSIRQVKSFCRSYDCACAVVGHPTKLEEGQRPGLYNISGCYSADTEVLTKRGWITHDFIKLDDDVLGFDPDTNALAWAHPSRVYSPEYDGEMINFRGYGYDILVTPDHRMVVKPKWKEPKGTQKKTGVGRPTKWVKCRWNFAEARNLEGGNHFAIPKAGYPVTGEESMTFDVGGVHVPMFDFMELLGWWLAEGCYQSSGASLCQAVGDGAARIDALIKSCGFHATRSIRKDPRGYKDMVTWYFGRRKNAFLVDWLKCNAGSGAAGKRIPQTVFELGEGPKISLFAGYIAGDGHRDGCRDACSSVTTSIELYDGFMRLAVECGIPVCGSVRTQPNSKHLKSFQTHFGEKSRREVTVRGSRNAKRVTYSGKVYCLTMPTGAYVIRRNGKVAICGNSSNWANKADHSFILHADSHEGTKREFIVPKLRHRGTTGNVGSCWLDFDEEKQLFFASKPPEPDPMQDPVPFSQRAKRSRQFRTEH